MAETPNPSSTQLLNAAGNFDGRISVALQEIKRRLGSNLPGLTSAANTRYGFTGSSVIRGPEFIRAAPIGIKDGEIANAIVLAAAKSTDAASPNKFMHRYEIAIMSIDISCETEEQYHRHWDRVGLIAAVLGAFVSGVTDDKGHHCWNTLTPSTTGWMPQDWKEYAGILLNYSMIIDPSKNNWDADT